MYQLCVFKGNKYREISQNRQFISFKTIYMKTIKLDQTDE